MKKNILIFSIALVAIIALALVLRFAISTPKEDFIVSGENYSGQASSEITVSNGGKVITKIPALKNETTKEITMEPIDLKPGGIVVSYVDKNGKTHNDMQIDITPGETTMNHKLYLNVTEVKDDGTMIIDYSYSSPNGDEISSQSN
ncbi:hypothetical protein [Listeria rustica]|uniref:Uncharacterized protein n=1 Tax=Listeria rustica TaxID=2713503 RepID=A0A7W1YEW1_9LIST|nr:hypothetical protein [Listeria rustica]MBA3925080.1 hypothetical protein [Listeria rustica]